MTARRLAHTPASPRMTSGYDRPAPACQGNPEPYDVLMDNISGPEFRAALREAKKICGTCKLQAQCLSENRNETWARALLGRPIAQKRTTCGTPAGYKAHSRAGEKACAECRKANAARVAEYAARTAEEPPPGIRLPRKYRTCTNCDVPMVAGRSTVIPEGYAEHHGNGLCRGCHAVKTYRIKTRDGVAA